MRLVWVPQAIEDLHSVRRYIASDKPEAAKRLVVLVAKTVNDQLTTFPKTGRPGRVKGTRELIISNTPFIVPYRITTTQIEILAVHHQARRWPDQP